MRIMSLVIYMRTQRKKSFISGQFILKRIQRDLVYFVKNILQFKKELIKIQNPKSSFVVYINIIMKIQIKKEKAFGITE